MRVQICTGIVVHFLLIRVGVSTYNHSGVIRILVWAAGDVYDARCELRRCPGDFVDVMVTRSQRFPSVQIWTQFSRVLDRLKKNTAIYKKLKIALFFLVFSSFFDDFVVFLCFFVLFRLIF